MNSACICDFSPGVCCSDVIPVRLAGWFTVTSFYAYIGKTVPEDVAMWSDLSSE